MKLCKDAKILDQKLTRTNVDLIFTKVKSKGTTKVSRGTTGGLSKTPLLFLASDEITAKSRIRPSVHQTITPPLLLTLNL